MASNEKHTSPTLYIEIKGGLIQEIYSSTPGMVVYIADRDLLIPPPMGDKLNQMADERLAQDDLFKIY